MHEAFTDTHAHLSYIEDTGFLEELDRVYGESKALIIDPGVDYNDFTERYNRYGNYTWIRFAAGIWPDEYPLRHQQTVLETLEQSLKHPSCNLVGECGLDYHWMKADPETQARLFSAQIELAVQYEKPLIIHSRDAFMDTLHCLKPALGKIPVVFHCFSYGTDELTELARLGFYISFSGNITYKRMKAVCEAIPSIPRSLLLLETDTPYQNPEPLRGRPSTPFDIARTYETISRIIGMDINALNELVTENCQRLLPR